MAFPLVPLRKYLQNALPDNCVLFMSNSFQVLFTYFLASTWAFPFQNLSSLYVVGHQVIQTCPCKGKIHSICVYLRINHYNTKIASKYTDKYCIKLIAMLGLGQWVEQCNLAMLCFRYCLIYIFSSLCIFACHSITLHSLLVIAIGSTVYWYSRGPALSWI